MIEEMFKYFLVLDYLFKEIIFINDGSMDGIVDILKEISRNYFEVCVIQFYENKGKVNVLYLGVYVFKVEFLICLDFDVILD